MKRGDIEYAVTRLLPDGWVLEALEMATEGFFVARVRQGRERARRVVFPAHFLTRWYSAEEVYRAVTDAIDQALGLGRYATTPIIQPTPAWSPYP